MRLSIDHRTIYRFSTPQARVTQMLRLTPEDTDDQTVASWHLHVDCDARLRPGRDGFGNKVTMLYAEGPISDIEIHVSGEVLTNSADGVVHGSHEVLPPPLFLRSTPLTEASEHIVTFARDVAAGGGDRIATLHRLNMALTARFERDRGKPIAGVTAAQAFVAPTATPRDLTHVFLAAARSLGVPARYISGYTVRAFGREHRPAAHGWAEAFVDGLGWVAFDPSEGRSADEAYVRVAMALDALGAAPVAGSRLGEGQEEMDVDVTVAPSGQ